MKNTWFVDVRFSQTLCFAMSDLKKHQKDNTDGHQQMVLHEKTPLEAGLVLISAWPAFMPTRAHAVAGTDLDGAAALDRKLGWDQPLFDRLEPEKQHQASSD